MQSSSGSAAAQKADHVLIIVCEKYRLERDDLHRAMKEQGIKYLVSNYPWGSPAVINAILQIDAAPVVVIAYGGLSHQNVMQSLAVYASFQKKELLMACLSRDNWPEWLSKELFREKSNRMQLSQEGKVSSETFINKLKELQRPSSAKSRQIKKPYEGFCFALKLLHLKLKAHFICRFLIVSKFQYFYLYIREFYEQ